MKVPFLDLKTQYQVIKSEVEPAVKNILEECSFIGGKYVTDFEKSMEAYLNVKHVASCSNVLTHWYLDLKPAIFSRETK